MRFVATKAIAAPAVRSVPAVATRSSEKKRFRLNESEPSFFMLFETVGKSCPTQMIHDAPATTDSEATLHLHSHSLSLGVITNPALIKYLSCLNITIL